VFVRDGVQVSRRSGPARPVLRVFFQKICGFQVGIFCSLSFLSKDPWFSGRNFLFPEFSFKRSVVSRSEFFVPRVFFQKICGFQAGISCSQSFLSKDLWFLGRNFLFPEFSFKRSVVFRSKFLVPRIFFQKICGFRARRTGRPGQHTVCRGPKTQVTFKIVPPVPRVQKLFRTSIAHFYFFTYRVPSPDQSRSQVPTPRLQRRKR
jgi:hypothetical protein